MKTLELTLPDQTFQRFQEVAHKMGLTMDQLLQITVEEKLERLDMNFQDATNYVLQKNKELYRRLA